jgi:hypothetical protein
VRIERKPNTTVTPLELSFKTLCIGQSGAIVEIKDLTSFQQLFPRLRKKGKTRGITMNGGIAKENVAYTSF